MCALAASLVVAGVAGSSCSAKSAASPASEQVWGDVKVTPEDGALALHIGPAATQAGRLVHWNYDTFRARLGDGRAGWTYVTFRLDGAGSVRAVRLDDSDAFEFVRLAPARPGADRQ